MVHLFSSARERVRRSKSLDCCFDFSVERQPLEARASISWPLRCRSMLNEVFGSNPFNVLPHVVALLVAYALAIPIGWNREQEERSAGLRTFPLVAVATCGFVQATETMFSDHPQGLARVMEGLITGMGFIGVGPILGQQGILQGT